MANNKRLNETARDGALQSPWQSQAVARSLAQGAEHTGCDVLIAGAGITGLTTGLMLQRAGKKCIIADAHRPGFGTTGGTSAHINTFADTTYKEAESAFGEQGAKLFAGAINEGFSIIRKHVEEFAIDCDFETKDGYLYAEDEKQQKELEDVYSGAVKVGISVQYNRQVPTPIPYKSALVFPGQAQFHPLKYLNGLIEQYKGSGGVLLENTLVEEVIEKDGACICNTANGSIKAGKVVYATHTVPGINIFSFRCAPYRSYVLGVQLADDAYPDALIYDMQEPYHYFRTHVINRKKLLIVGGNDHKTGHEDPGKAFAELEKYVKQHYNVEEIVYRSSSQYYVPVDGLPYIGEMPGSNNIYCATGYNGNGMMLGSIAGKILTDIIVKGESKYQQVFKPGRMKPIAGFSEFVKENADVVKEFVGGRLSLHKIDSVQKMGKCTGEVVSVDGKRVAVYKDENGNVHALDPVCTHAGCIVQWNKEEKSWDCPCHGARYDIDGAVLTGPTTRALKIVHPDE